MWWSHHDRETSLEILRDAGFGIEAARERTSSGACGDETWLWVLAGKPR